MRNARTPRGTPALLLGSRGLVPVLATVALAVLFVTGSVADAFAQTGYVQTYAFFIVAGLLVMFGYYVTR